MSTTITQPAAPSRPTPSVSSPIRRPSFLRLTRIELRKATDYRAGRWILGVILLLSVLAMGWDVAHANDRPISLMSFVNDSLTPALLLLPVIGILAMTSEWTQRTALTTFTLSPRRAPVLVAKLVAALVLMLAVVAAVVVLTVGATALAGAVTGDPVHWATTWRDWVAQLLPQALYLLMGAGFGALIPVTGVALTGFFVAPTLLTILTNTVLKKIGEWVDVFGAFDRLSSLHFDGKGAQTASSVAIWIVVPLVLGIFLSTRREVK